MARRYPQLGLVLPYDFALAAAPFITGTRAWGGLALLWPVGHPAHLSTQQREAVIARCRRTALLLEQAAAQGDPLPPPGEARYLPVSPEDSDPEQAMAALGFTERLPMGCCALDLEGRLTFINSAGAELVGADAASLTGRRPGKHCHGCTHRSARKATEPRRSPAGPPRSPPRAPRTSHSSSSSTPTTAASASTSHPPRLTSKQAETQRRPTDLNRTPLGRGP